MTTETRKPLSNGFVERLVGWILVVGAVAGAIFGQWVVAAVVALLGLVLVGFGRHRASTWDARNVQADADERARGPQAPEGVTANSKGVRYVIGHGDDFYGIWDSEAPGEPVERFPLTDAAWEEAWARFQQLEGQLPRQ